MRTAHTRHRRATLVPDGGLVKPHGRGKVVRRAVAAAAAIGAALAILGTAGPAGAAAVAGVAVAAGPAGVTADLAPSDPAPGEPDPEPSNSPAPTPVPVDPTPVEPTPTEPTPTPTPTGPTPGMPTSVDPPPTPPSPSPPGSPALEPWAPWSPTLLGLGPGGAAAPVAPSAIAAPAAFGRVYPTNPWIYNAEPGTRFLDVREHAKGEVVRRHMGIDAQGGIRQPIFAVADGIVADGTWGTTRQDRHGFGNQVRITHADGYATRYAHLAEPPLVRPGEHVRAGQLIGYMGGSQRGDLDRLVRHLHFEVTQDGRSIDPLIFLTGASTVGGDAPATTMTGSRQLYEIRPADTGFASTPTGVMVSSGVFTAIATGPDSTQILTSENGRLQQISGVDGSWTKADTGVDLDATSLSGVSAGGTSLELLAVEDGKLYHLAGDAGQWTKTWTGHYFSGSVSAVRMPGGGLHALLEQAGYLYHLRPAQAGLWDVIDTRVAVGPQVDAVHVGGSMPEAMTVIDGLLYRITRGELTWKALPTGLPASGTLATVDEGAGWPTAISAGPDAVGVARVVDGVWTRSAFELATPAPPPGAMDAVTTGAGVVLYATG